MKTYRVYEAIRNNGGGLDAVGGQPEYIEAETAEKAAETVADNCAGLDFDPQTVFVATDDDGDSAIAEAR